MSAVDTSLVIQIVEPLWTQRTATADRVRAWLAAILDWAKVHGYRSGDNPAEWRGHLDKILPARGKVTKTKHLPALPYVETGAFMVELRTHSSIPAWCLEFTILTAVRSSEAINASWSEFDLANALWVIPAGRMKGGREHRVPLAPRVVELLRAMPRENNNPHVFIGATAGRPINPMAMVKLLRRMQYDKISVHGFRSSFRDWSAECTNVPREIAEQSLAHVVGNAVERSYRRTDMFEKRAS